MYGFTWDTSTTLSFAWSILPILGIGLIVTLEAAAAGFAIALVLGLVFALLRRSRFVAISWPTAFVIEFLRDTPLLVQLFFLYYVLPIYGIVLPAFLTGALALGFNIPPIRRRSIAAAWMPCRLDNGKLRRRSISAAAAPIGISSSHRPFPASFRPWATISSPC
jgi:His/Glu/Gln/Arg/opine family amino acid ABC transporter permease subunit